MPDVLISDVDDAVVAALEFEAKARGISVPALAAAILRERTAVDRFSSVAEAIKAMRDEQSMPRGDAAAEVRALRDGDVAADGGQRAA